MGPKRYHFECYYKTVFIFRSRKIIQSKPWECVDISFIRDREIKQYAVIRPYFHLYRLASILAFLIWFIHHPAEPDPWLSFILLCVFPYNNNSFSLTMEEWSCGSLLKISSDWKEETPSFVNKKHPIASWFSATRGFHTTLFSFIMVPNNSIFSLKPFSRFNLEN